MDDDFIYLSKELATMHMNPYRYHNFTVIALMCDRRYKADRKQVMRYINTKRRKQEFEKMVEEGMFEVDDEYISISDDYKRLIMFPPAPMDLS